MRSVASGRGADGLRESAGGERRCGEPSEDDERDEQSAHDGIVRRLEGPAASSEQMGLPGRKPASVRSGTTLAARARCARAAATLPP